MNFSIIKNLTSKTLLSGALLYICSALLVGVIIVYGVFFLKGYLLNQKLADIEQKIANFGTPSQKADEKLVLNYKKTVDDFEKIFSEHRISSNVFDLFEQSTLSNVWFSNFSMNEGSGVVQLSGEAENLEVLSRQVKIFEQQEGLISSVSTLSTQVNANGKIRFVLSIKLNQLIFKEKQAS